MYDERAQSEVLGTILLVAIVVLVVSTVGVIVVSDLSNQEQQVSALIDGEVTTETVEFQHGGGDPIPAGELLVVVRNGSSEQQIAFAPEDIRGDGDDLFEPGERWVNDSVSFEERDEGEQKQRVQLLLVHRPSGSLLFDGVRLVG